MTQKIRRGIALWFIFLWMSPTAVFSDGPIPEIDKEKAALLEMMAFVSELEGSQLPALKVVRDKAEALIERLRSKEDPLRKKEAELIDTKILKPIEGLIRMGDLLEACARGEEPLLSGLGRQFVRAMVERLNIGECRDLEAIAIAPKIMALARNVSQIEEASLSRKPRPKKVDDSELFEKILQKSREMAIVSYFKEYSRLQGEIHFDPIGDTVKVTQESADAYFRITGENIFEPETFKSFFYLSQEKRGVGVPLSQIHRERREEFKRSQKSSYEEFVKENRETYRKGVEKALEDLSQVKKEVLEAEEKVRLLKQLHNARFILHPDELTALESSTAGGRYEGPRLTRRGPYGGFYSFDEVKAPATETGRYDAYDGVVTLSSNPIDVDHFLRRTMVPPETISLYPTRPTLEEGEKLLLTYLDRGKNVSSDFSRARDLGYYAEPAIENPKERFKAFLNNAFGSEAFSQFDHYLEAQLKAIRERSKSDRVFLDKDELAQRLQAALAQVIVDDREGRRGPALINAKERLAELRARYEVLKSGMYRHFIVVRHDPEIQKMWENDETKPISSDSIDRAWQTYDASMQKFLKETLPSLKAEGEKDPKKQIKLALKSHPSAVLAVLLDDPRIEVAKRICDLGNEIKVDEAEAEESSLTWGLGATLAVGANAALTYGMGPLFGYGLGFGAYGDAIFSGTATAIGVGHMGLKSIPDYQALAFEGEVMEDILLALGEGDPRDVADKMGEMNARFVDLIGEGFLNAVGGLAFIKAARNIPAGLRAEAIRRELEALKRASQDAKGAAQANVRRGLGRDFDETVYNGKPVWGLNNDERFAYAEKVLGYKPGVLNKAEATSLRQALLDAHNFNEAKLGEELLSRGRSLNEFTSDKIRRMVIAGKARRLQPFAPSERKALMEKGIAGEEDFLRGGSRGELENTLAKLGEREVGFHIKLGTPGEAPETFRSPSEAFVGEVGERTLLKGFNYKVTRENGEVFSGELIVGERGVGDDLALVFKDDKGVLHSLGPEDMMNIEPIKPNIPLQPSQVFPEQPRLTEPPKPPSVASEVPKPPSPAVRPPAEVAPIHVERFPERVFRVHTVRYFEPPKSYLLGLWKGKPQVRERLATDLEPYLFIDKDGFATPGFVVKSTEGTGTALRTGVAFVRGGRVSVNVNMEQIAEVQPVLATPKRIYLREQGMAPEVGDVVFYRTEGEYKPSLVIHKGEDQLVLGRLDPMTGEIIKVEPLAVKEAISGTNRIKTGEIIVPENSPLRTLPEAKSPAGGNPAGGSPKNPPPPPPGEDFIFEYKGGKLDLPSVPDSIKRGQKLADDIIHTSSKKSVTIHTTSGNKVTVREGGVYTVMLENESFKGAYMGKIVTKDGKTIYYFDDGTNDVGRAIEGAMILRIN